MKASSVSFQAAILFVIAGMIWGMAMAMSQDHSTFPAHAHLNLVGFVSLFLFGIFYHLHPAIDRSRLAVVQALVWVVGTIVMTIGVGLVHGGHEAADPIAALGALVILADTLVFGYIVVRRDTLDRPAAALAPAE
jgi:peptidoglycan/LPS O-acetylase OafA/YrhL